LEPLLAPRVESTTAAGLAAPPRLLRCLVVSASATRRKLIRAAAESEAWEAIVCRDAGEFLRTAFKRCVPLMIVDLPGEESADYWALRDAASAARQISTALVAVAGYGIRDGEELWARQLGAWTYLSEAHTQRGFELVFSDARTAVARCSPDVGCGRDGETDAPWATEHEESG
jgi:hypothetical protein